MAKKVISMQYRRKREGKTNYKFRLKILKGRKTRVVVRKSLKNIYVQFVDFKPAGDVIVASASGKDISKLGWNFSTSNISAAYLIGLLAGVRAIKNGVKDAVFDMGLQKSVAGSKIFGALRGIVDSGIKIPHADDVLPDEDRVSGKHIAELGKTIPEKGNQFADVLKKAKLEDVPKVFAEVKDKISKPQKSKISEGDQKS